MRIGSSGKGRRARYAAAVHQAGLARPRGCAVTGPRWSEDHLLHYRWCLRQSGSQPETEAGERSRLLATCGVVSATPIRLPDPEARHP